MGSEDKKIVRKSEFASICGVTPARVSQWISEGKLTGEAFIGEGRTAKINLAVAVEQLKARLDASQRFGLNGLGTRLSASIANPPEQLAFEAPPPESGRDTPFDEDSVIKKIQAEKLRQAQLLTVKMEAEDRVSKGFYVRSADVEKVYNKFAVDLLAAWEGSFPEIAAALSAQFGIPSRDALVMLKKDFRAFRAHISKIYSDLAASEPKTIEDHDTYH